MGWRTVAGAASCGRSPAPNVDAIRSLITTVRDGNYDLGLAMDGDADRIAIVDEAGNYIHINDILLLLYYYLHKVRGERGGVVRNLVTIGAFVTWVIASFGAWLILELSAPLALLMGAIFVVTLFSTGET